jgi:hypothetical protein
VRRIYQELLAAIEVRTNTTITISSPKTPSTANIRDTVVLPHG